MCAGCAQQPEQSASSSALVTRNLVFTALFPSLVPITEVPSAKILLSQDILSVNKGETPHLILNAGEGLQTCR
jgi:hypothetical protein